MKKLVCFKKSLLMGAVALSLLSSPANAVQEDEVKKFLDTYNASSLKNDVDALNSLKSIEGAQWELYTSMVQSLKDAEIVTSSQIPDIKALAKVFSTRNAQFLDTYHALVTSDMTGYPGAVIINTLINVEPKNWDQLVKASKSLTQGMTGLDCAHLIQAFTHFIPEKWDEFVIAAKSLKTEDMTSEEWNRFATKEMMNKSKRFYLEQLVLAPMVQEKKAVHIGSDEMATDGVSQPRGLGSDRRDESDERQS